jgi:CheY-like chemotaxis protein
MLTKSALSLADTVAKDSQRPGAPSGRSSSSEIGFQAASVRALVDEVERQHPGDSRIAPLRHQLGEELTRLAQLVDLETGGEPGESAASEEPMEVLVVDDEEDNLRATVAALRMLGYPTRTARDGAEALAMFAERPSPIVLSDWCMPKMNGRDLCAALKRLDHRPYVILATAFHDDARLIDGVTGGVDDFLRKPIDMDELEARLLSGTRLIRALRAVGAVGERLRARVI